MMKACLSVDPGETNFACAAVIAPEAGIPWRVVHARWDNVRFGDNSTWSGEAVRAAMDAAFDALEGVPLADVGCLIENQHLNNDRGNQVLGAVKMYAETRGAKVTLVNPAVRGAHFAFAKLSRAVLAKATNPCALAYHKRKQESAKAVLGLIAEHPERFAPAVKEALAAATERTGKFDMSDAVTSGIAFVERGGTGPVRPSGRPRGRPRAAPGGVEDDATRKSKRAAARKDQRHRQKQRREAAAASADADASAGTKDVVIVID